MPRRRADLMLRPLGTELAVYDTATDTAHTLSPHAARVFEAADGRSDIKAVAARLSMTPADVQSALTELDRAGLLSAGTDRRTVLRGGALVAGAAVAAPLISSVIVPAAAAAASTTSGGAVGGGAGFIDIRSTGTPVFLGTNGNYDDSTTTITSDFPLDLYGVSSSSVLVCVNGFLSLGGVDHGFSNTVLPNNSDSALFPFWDDLYVDANSDQGVWYETVGTAPNRVFVVQWRTDRFDTRNSGATILNFEVQAFENAQGKYAFEYGSLTGPNSTGDSATIGVQGGGTVDQHSFDTPGAVSSNSSLTYSHP